MKKYNLLLVILLISSSLLLGQEYKVDSLNIIKNEKLVFKSSALIIPVSLVTFGFIGERNDRIESFNANLQERVTDNLDRRVAIDDYSQYTPILSVYGLNALGLKGKHNFKDRTIILTTAYLTMGTLVYGLKNIIDEQRPDNSTNNTFPSGHTATAFMGAEFLFQEFKHKSVWIGIAGYTIAGITGYYRMANNRHWFSDVVGGAGIGILSTKFAYWVYPFLKKKLFKNKHNLSGMAIPFYNGKEYGIGITLKL